MRRDTYARLADKIQSRRGGGLSIINVTNVGGGGGGGGGDYLLLAGGTMTGSITMGGHDLISVGNLNGFSVDTLIAASHSRLHNILSIPDHSVVGSAFDLVGVVATNTLGMHTPSANPGVAAALLRTTAGGALTLFTLETTDHLTTPAIDSAANLTLAPTGNVVINTDVTLAGDSWSITAAGVGTFPQVITPLVTTATNIDLVLSPGGTGAVQIPNATALRSSSFDSSFPTLGWRVAETLIGGQSQITISIGQFDELRARIFVADEQRVDRGNQYWTKSFGILAAGFTTPSAIGGTVTVTFEDSPALTAALFTVNDWLLFQSLEIDTGISLFNIWGQVSGYVDNLDGTQNWTFTLRAGPTNEAIRSGQPGIDFGQSGAALIHLSTVDPNGAPYIKMRTWAGANPYTPVNFTTHLQIGHLGSIANTYYTPSGYGLWVRPGNDDSRFLIADNNGLQARGLNISLYNGATQTVNIDYLGTNFWIGNGAADKRLFWNGTILTITGSITILNPESINTGDLTNTAGWTVGATWGTNLANQPDSLSDINGTEGTKLAGIAAGATVGATWGTNINSIPTRFGNAPGAAGLYLTATHLGYYNGSAWKAWLASNGFFYFGGDSGAHLEWNGSHLRGIGADGTTVQWYASSTDGKMYAGAGNVQISSEGIDLQQDGYITNDESRAISWWKDIGTKAELSQTIKALFGPFVTSILSLESYPSAGGTSQVSLVADNRSVTLYSDGYFSIDVLTSTQHLLPQVNNTYDIGSDTLKYNDLYVTNLHVDTIVGTPSYAHNHTASEITSGTLNLARIPAILTGKDADTLDGVHGSGFANSGHNHDGSYVPLARTVSAGAGMTGGGALTANITLAHADTSSAVTTTNINGSVIHNLTFDTYGHVTARSSVDLDLRYAQLGELGGYVPTSRTVTAGAGLSGGGALSGNITLAHADTSAAADTTNADGYAIQNLTFDTYGHVTARTAVNLDLRYYTETETDALIAGVAADLGDYLPLAGGTLTGPVIFNNDISGPFWSILATGAVSFGADLDYAQTLGRAVIGPGAGADTATFAHYDYNGTDSFALTQSNTGETIINAAFGGAVHIAVDGSPVWTVTDMALIPRSTREINIGDYNRQIGTLFAAEMAVQNLVVADVRSTLGGGILVAPTTKLISILESGGGDSDLYTNMLAYWSLNETTGTRADSVGLNNLTAGTGGTISFGTGKQGNALSLTNAYLQIADNADLSVDDINFYFSGWFYTGADDGEIHTILSKGTNAARSYAVNINWAGAYVAFDIYSTSGSLVFVKTPDSALTPATWYFVEAWHNAVTNKIGIALNRTEVTKNYYNGAHDEAGAFLLGASHSDAPVRTWEGFIDEVGFWKNYVPSEVERDWLYNSGAGRTFAAIASYGTGGSVIAVEHNIFITDSHIMIKGIDQHGNAEFEPMQIKSEGTPVTGGYSYSVDRNLDGGGAHDWLPGTAVVNTSNGYLDLASVTTVNSHYGPTLTVYQRTDSLAWDSIAATVSTGNLRSFVDYSTDTFGIALGNDLTLSPAAGFSGMTADHANGMRIFNTDLVLYNAGAVVLNINSTNGFNILAPETIQDRANITWQTTIGNSATDIGSIKLSRNDAASSATMQITANDSLAMTTGTLQFSVYGGTSSLAYINMQVMSDDTSSFSIVTDSITTFAEIHLQNSGTIDGVAALTIGATDPTPYAKVSIAGTNNSAANGPHIATVGSSDAYPLLQFLSYAHDNIALGFDTYFDASSWKASDATGFLLYKNVDKFQIRRHSGSTPGATATLSTALDIDLVTGAATFYNALNVTGTLGAAWTAPVFNTGWQNLSGYQAVNYKKVGDFVFLRGMAERDSGTNTTIFTLPVGFRPAAHEFFIQMSSGDSLARVRVYSTGAVLMEFGNYAWVSLSGIVFSTA